MHSICRGFWFFQGHTWTHAPAQAHTMHTHTHSENALAQFRGEARPVSSPGLTVEGGPQRWVGVDWVCSATAHGTTNNITGLTLSPTHTHLKSGQLLHTQFNQGLCLWKWAYVTSSVSTPPPPTPASLSFYLSINVSFCLSHGLLLLLSVWLPVCFETFYLFHSSYRSTFKRWQGMWFSESKSKAH